MEYHGVEHVYEDRYAEIRGHAEHCQHERRDKRDTRIEQLIDRCEDYPESLKEYSPSKHHLAACYRCDKHFAYREVKEKDEQKGKEKIKRQQI